LEEQHLPFEVEDCDQIGLFANWPLRRIYVRWEDKEKAQAISDEESARPRATAAFSYMAVGGVICAWALLKMRSGILTISTIRDGEIPVEMVAGVGGIVIFMGLLQLLIAIILKLRGRQ